MTGREALTVAEAVHQIRAELLAVQNAPHEEHAGPLCPICGLTTSLLAKLREEMDALALREHIAANPTPPDGPAPSEKEVVVAPTSGTKVTEFRRKDGSLLATFTFKHGFSKITRLRGRA